MDGVETCNRGAAAVASMRASETAAPETVVFIKGELGGRK
jgi:hypothetical protein